MKCKNVYLLLITALITACSNNSIVYQSYDDEKIIHHSKMESVENISDYVIYLDKGDEILVQMTLDSNLAEIADEKTNLVLKQKIYFRFILPKGVDFEKLSSLSEDDKEGILKNVMIYLSSDANEWAPYTDINAVKQVLGIKGGSLSVGMGASKEEGVKIMLNVRTMHQG